MPDLRNLPTEVRTRVATHFGPDYLNVRHDGVDINHRGHVLEHRATQRLEVRAADDSPTELVGYATVYDVPYEVLGGPPWGWTETIARGAADKSVREQDQVYLFFDHEGLPIASTRAGTLELESDQVGLYNRATPDMRSPWNTEILSRVQSGELDAMSFAFRAIRSEWDENFEERTILEVKLFDVSVVSYPANPATVVNARDDKPVRGMNINRARGLVDLSRRRR